MNPFDETPPRLPGPSSTPARAADQPAEDQPAEEQPALFPALASESPVSEIPQTHAAGAEPFLPPAPPRRVYPLDLQITWSWPHFLILILFGFISLAVVQGVLAGLLLPHKHLSPLEMENYLLSNPKFSIGSMLIWYALVFLFLYVTLSLLRGHSFWEILGWRKIQPKRGELPRNPFVYFIAGCGLSLFVAVVSSRMKTPENIPIEELFKYRQTALLFMAMAVLVAPLVEETIFRGYLYPLFARSFGVAPGIIITGVLFGLMHGAQLGWTWALVAVLIFVGIVFTLVRARTGSVFASYMMHLGYNGLISGFAILGTHGFTKLPPSH
jgi:membrane protease YdiL (CAAX protease family)